MKPEEVEILYQEWQARLAREGHAAGKLTRRREVRARRIWNVSRRSVPWAHVPYIHWQEMLRSNTAADIRRSLRQRSPWSPRW